MDKQFKEKMYPINGYEDYLISKSGKVYSTLTEKFLKHDLNRGYCSVKLADRRIGRYIKLFVHRIVAVQFLKNPNNLPEVNHKDGNHGNNSVWNLEWCTSEYNRRHAKENGLYKSEEDNPRAKLTKDQVIEIYELYKTNKNKTEIASMYNVSNPLIGEIVRGVRWSKTFEEYHGYKPIHVKKKRKRIPNETIKYIFNEYYFNNKDTVVLSNELNISNSHIGNILKGKHRFFKNKDFTKEIQLLLDNQQPSSNGFEKVQRLKGIYPLKLIVDNDIV